MPGNEGIRYLLNRYRTAQTTGRDALVLALIGEVVTQMRRRECPATLSGPTQTFNRPHDLTDRT